MVHENGDSPFSFILSEATDGVKPILEYFIESFGSVRAEGDRCVMMAALYNRVLDPHLEQPRDKRPARTRVIHRILESEFGIRGLPKWGATAVRGDLIDEKEHIRLFIDRINELAPNLLQEAWELCGKAYRLEMARKNAPVVLAPETPLVSVLRQLAVKPSGGIGQQALAYACAKRLFEALFADGYEVHTKATFAGDAQSGVLGDIQVVRADKLLLAYEVKAMVLDELALTQVLTAHGDHRYQLVVLATGFAAGPHVPPNTSLVTIDSFVNFVLGISAALLDESQEAQARLILRHYNEYVSSIEGKPGLAFAIPDP